MTINAMGDLPKFPPQCTRQHMTHHIIKLVLTTAGAVAATTSYPSPDFSVTKKGATTGVYDVVFPKCKEAYAKATIQKSAAATVVAAFGLAAADAAAGTWEFQTWLAAAADPASGDEILIELWTKDR